MQPPANEGAGGGASWEGRRARGGQARSAGLLGAAASHYQALEWRHSELDESELQTQRQTNELRPNSLAPTTGRRDQNESEAKEEEDQGGGLAEMREGDQSRAGIAEFSFVEQELGELIARQRKRTLSLLRDRPAPRASSELTSPVQAPDSLHFALAEQRLEE